MAPEHERRILVQCLRERLPLPQKIQNAPELKLGLELYFGAFFDLNTCRPSGWSIAPIPWSVINDYAQTFELDEMQTEDLFFFVGHMDAAFINHHRAKTEKSAAAITPKPHGKRSSKL
jgi:hypothetical protein